jgi:hypothetical protein
VKEMNKSSIDKLKNIEIFEGKSVDEIFKVIFEYSLEERNAALDTFNEFKKHIKDGDDLFMSGDKPQGYLDSAHKATENLIKLISAAQKLVVVEEESENNINATDILDILDKQGIAPDRFIDKKEEEVKEKNKKDESAMKEITFPTLKKKVD